MRYNITDIVKTGKFKEKEKYEIQNYSYYITIMFMRISTSLDLSFFSKVNLGKFRNSKGNEFQTNGPTLRN